MSRTATGKDVAEATTVLQGKRVLVTRPQTQAHDLMARLVAEGYDVLLETGGHVPIDDVPDEVMTILDVKCPGSGEAKAMHWPNLDQVSARDE